MTLLKN
jgi:Ca2+-binding EF-hand superfamily protein